MAINTTLLITREDFLPYTDISNFLSQERSIDPYILEAQEVYLRGIIGGLLLDRLAEAISSGYSDDAEDALLEYVRPWLVHRSKALYLLEANFYSTNAGIVSFRDEESTPVSGSKLADLAERQERLADTYLAKLRAFLRDNLDDYPEYRDGLGVDVDRGEYVTDIRIIRRRRRSEDYPYRRRGDRP